MAETRFKTVTKDYKRRYGNSRDHSLAADLVGAITSVPRNFLYLLPFTDPQDIQFDEVARIGERFVFRWYEPYIRFRQAFTPFSPRKENFWKNLRRLDLDSGNYLEDFITVTDEAMHLYLEPLLKYPKNIDQDQAHAHLESHYHEKFLERLEQIRNEILSMHVPDEKCLKVMRMKSMVEYLDLIKNKLDIVRNPQGYSAEELEDARYLLDDYLRQKEMRRTGVMQVEKNGEILLESNNAATEYTRRLKRQFDQCYINPHRRKLPISEPEDKAENSENYFILTAGFGFKDDGITPVSSVDQTPNYIEQFIDNLYMMYRSGREHDMLRALQMCKYQESLKSHQIIPGKFRQLLREQLRADFINNGLDIDKDEHYAYFDKKLEQIQNRDHAPEGDGPRDTNNTVVRFIRNYVYGRLYPGKRKGKLGLDGKDVDAYAATPYSANKFQNPVLGFRQKVRAYFTGGIVVPMPEADRKTPTEKQCGTTITRNWLFWRKPSEEEHLKKYNGFINRAPVWFSVPLRLTMLASVPAALVVGTGLVTAAAPIAWPLMAAGALSATKYATTSTQYAWSTKWGHRAMVGTGLAAVTGLAAGASLMLFPTWPALALAGAATMAAAPAGIAAISSTAVIGTSLLGWSTYNTINAFAKGDEFGNSGTSITLEKALKDQGYNPKSVGAKSIHKKPGMQNAAEPQTAQQPPPAPQAQPASAAQLQHEQLAAQFNANMEQMRDLPKYFKEAFVAAFKEVFGNAAAAAPMVQPATSAPQAGPTITHPFAQSSANQNSAVSFETKVPSRGSDPRAQMDWGAYEYDWV